MSSCATLATQIAAYYDPRTAVSALAVQHVRAEGRTVLVYHDAPSVAASRPLLASVADALSREVPAGHVLGLIESSIPEHVFEPFVYARVILSCAAWPGHLNAGTGRVLGPAGVAAACGVEEREIERTEALVLAVHRPRTCAFPGFRQLPLGERAGRFLAVA